MYKPNKLPILPILAGLGLLLGLHTVVSGSQPPPTAPAVTEPADSPFKSFVAGSGIVEPQSESIAIASPLSGVVKSVFVAVGSTVKAGDPLFALDDREIAANIVVAQSNLDVARAELADAKNQYLMRATIKDARAVSAEELSSRRYASATAEAKVVAAESTLRERQVELERLTVRAPIDGQILQVKVRVGEFAPAQALENPLMILGNVSRLIARVDVDENDAWRLHAGARAVAYIRGNKKYSAELQFERFEPFVIPKKSLTGQSNERVDTRVLQVIYSFDPKSLPIFVGQLLDVFIESTIETSEE